MIHKALKASEILKDNQIDSELIDLRTLVPLDIDAIINSVKKTGRLIIVQEAYRTGGFAGEIAAIVAENAFKYLKSPIIRVTSPDTTIPLSPILEDEFIPSPEKIVNAALKLTKEK